MSIFLSGNNVASQPYIVKTNNNSKPPTNLSLPIGVDYLLPENGGAAVGSIKNIGSGDAILYVVLAGENDLTNQITYTLSSGQTLDAQIRYISDTSTYGGGLITEHDGALAMSVSLSSNSTITAPFYNFMIKADWYSVFSIGNTPTQSDLENWLSGQSIQVISITNFTYVESTYLDPDSGYNVGEISCDLIIDAKNNNISFSNNFYEINGIGQINGDKFHYIFIEDNNNLSFVKGYYTQDKEKGLYLGSNYLNIVNNPTLQYIDSYITLSIYTNINIGGNYDLKEITNNNNYYYCFNDNLRTLNISDNSNFIDAENKSTNYFKFDLTLVNLLSIDTIQIVNNGLEYFNWNNLPRDGSNYTIRLNDNLLTEFAPENLPDQIPNIYLSGNKISKFKPKDLPNSLVGLYLDNNQLSNIDVDFNWATECPALQQLDLSSNFISKLNQSLKSIQNVYLSNNLLYDWNNYVQFTTNGQSVIDLSSNKFTTIPTNLPYTYLSSIYLSYNPISSIPNLSGYTYLNQLYLQNCNISGNVNIQAIPSLYYLYLDNNPINSITFTGTFSNLTGLYLPGTNISSITGSYTNLPILQGIILENCPSLVRFDGVFTSTLQQIDLNSCIALSIFNPTASGITNLAITKSKLTVFNYTLPSTIFSFNLQDNPLLTSVTTPINNNVGYWYLNGNPLLTSVNLGSTNKFPYFIDLSSCGMTTASWNNMNTWATGLANYTGSGRNFNAYSNTNTIAGTTLQTTLISKGISVNA